MPSTVIREFEYDADSLELLITFVSGRRYVYLGVPEEEHAIQHRAFQRRIFQPLYARPLSVPRSYGCGLTYLRLRPLRRDANLNTARLPKISATIRAEITI